MPSVRSIIIGATTNTFRYKDADKFSSITKFIGHGSIQSSTHKYAQALGNISNTGVYVSTDIVGISVEGNRRNRVRFNQDEVSLACDAETQIITDNQANRMRPYNIGEREVASFLIDQGYIEVGAGIWLPK